MWNVINAILSGGPLKGYKTYIGGAGLMIAAIVPYLDGTQTLSQFLTGPGLLAALAGLGLVGVRNAIAGHADLIQGAIDAIAAIAAAQNKPAAPTTPTAPTK